MLDWLKKLFASSRTETDAAYAVIASLKATLLRWGINDEEPPVITLLPVNGYNLVKDFYAEYHPITVSQDDLTYSTCSLEDLEKFLAWDWTWKIPYVPEAFDCDDFQETLLVHAAMVGITAMFGIRTRHAEGVNHAFCGATVYVDGVLRTVLIEPQASAIVEAEAGTIYDPNGAELLT